MLIPVFVLLVFGIISRGFSNLGYYGMDVPIAIEFLRPILTVTTTWNTGETGDIYTTPI